MVVIATFMIFLVGLTGLPGAPDEAGLAAVVTTQHRAPLTSERAGEAVNADTHEPEREEILIRWLKADLSALDHRVKGVALLDSSRSRCVLVAPEVQADGDPVYVLGHEALHCFKGRFHGSKGEPGEIDQSRAQMLTTVLPGLLPSDELEAVKRFLGEE